MTETIFYKILILVIVIYLEYLLVLHHVRCRALDLYTATLITTKAVIPAPIFIN